MSTQSQSRYLTETPPYCPTVECYMHGNGIEHHVEGCPVYETLGQVMHRFGHASSVAAKQIVEAFEPFSQELRKTWRGRVLLAWIRVRHRWVTRR